jgi:hypothetical protein
VWEAAAGAVSTSHSIDRRFVQRPDPDGRRVRANQRNTSDRGRRVVLTDLVDGSYEGGWFESATDANGSLSVMTPRDRPVKITAFDGGGPLWNQSRLGQSCAVQAEMTRDTAVEIELVPRGSRTAD